MRILSLFLLLFSVCTFAQTEQEIIKDINAYRAGQNEKFKTKDESPLTDEDRKTFKSLTVYPIDLAYRVKAKFVKAAKTNDFKMKTSGTRTPEYRKYGELHFAVNGKALVLSVYQHVASLKDEKYKDDLFIPFKDHTNGETTYGGGRYMDLKLPLGKEVILDFNKTYNPYCAYSTGWSCPVPPSENHLDVAIEAGIKAYKKHH